MPSNEKLNYFYEKIYRSNERPPFLVSENYEDQKKYYLEDKNLSYVNYITTLIDVKKINILPFWRRKWRSWLRIKKKVFKNKSFLHRGDKYCERILNERGYKNIKNLDDLSQKFDLITTTHSLEHLSDINSIFTKFKEILNKDGHIFLRYLIAQKNILMAELMIVLIYFFWQQKVSRN